MQEHNWFFTIEHSIEWPSDYDVEIQTDDRPIQFAVVLPAAIKHPQPREAARDQREMRILDGVALDALDEGQLPLTIGHQEEAKRLLEMLVQPCMQTLDVFQIVLLAPQPRTNG